MPGVKLNPNQQAELREAFTIYDSNGDGKVNREEATYVIRSIALSPTNEEFNHMLAAKELFTFEDIQTIVSTKAPPIETDEELKEAFRIFDKYGGGYIDVKELRHVLVNLGERLKDDEVDAIFREVEITGDNQINYDEMVRMIQCVYD